GLGLAGRVEEGLLRGVELVTGGACGGLGRGCPLSEGGDEVLDALDLSALRRLVRLGALHVVPARVIGGVGGLTACRDAVGGESDGAERTGRQSTTAGDLR